MNKINKKGRTLSMLGFFAPALILMLIFFVGPMVLSVYFSFTNMSLTGSSAQSMEFVGFRNFTELFADPQFYSAIKKTIIFVVIGGLIGQQVLGFLFAFIMRKKGKHYRRVIGFPFMIGWCCPMVVAAYAFLAYFEENGTLNKLIGYLGIEPVTWLYTFPLTCVIIATIWKGTAYCMMMYQASLDNISDDLLEAARIDGANGIQIMFKIIIPFLKQTIGTVSMIVTLNTLGAFGLGYAMLKGGPGNATTTLPIYMYKQAFISYQLGYGTSIALIMLLIGIVFAFLYIRTFNGEKGRKVSN